ncbi:MAG TPA: efflux RND transporter periplasmic adaptor subunit [Methyloceanibacter sp.]|jgi:Cu(I)/Ag(I) efflux system membrane fusion protein|nr:efflux RND transporter periplasmic adaptor subunit [Methyloceanibacter sp.]
MRRLNSLIVLVAGIAAGAAGSYWYAHRAETVATPASAGQPAPADGGREILYYRNPMGLPDTSPVPKKDPMGMDYIAVYADEHGDSNTVKVSLDKVQRSGVRTEKVASLPITRTVRGVGTVEHDETSLRIVTVRSDGYIEDLFVNKTGQHVAEGEPLFRFYSPQIQLAQADLVVALRAERPSAKSETSRNVAGAIQRLRNLDVPDSRIEEVRAGLDNPRTIDWASPATGDVIAKNVIEGQRVVAGDELFRIADHTSVWVVAEIAEADSAAIEVGMPASVTLRALPNERHEGKVSFIYPEMMKPETRTISVRIELPNPDGKAKTGMYADVVFRVGDGEAPAVAVPDSAIIDSGTRQVVLVAKGEGRFEPREVKIGRRGEGHTEIVSGLVPGEEIVTSATFLIDAESNLKAALQAFSRGEPK